MPLNTTMRDVLVLLISWGSALLISLGLRWWGDRAAAGIVDGGLGAVVCSRAWGR
jgi:hypothetical protein